MQAIVEAIFIAPKGGADMRPLSEVVAVPGGLEGDRYSLGRGYWSGDDGAGPLPHLHGL